MPSGAPGAAWDKGVRYAALTTGLAREGKRLLQSFLLFLGEQLLDLLAGALVGLPIEGQIGIAADLVEQGFNFLILLVGELDAGEHPLHVRRKALFIDGDPLLGSENFENNLRQLLLHRLVAGGLPQFAVSGLGLLFLFVAEFDRSGQGLDPGRYLVVGLLLLLLGRKDVVELLLRILHNLVERGVEFLIRLRRLGNGVLVVLLVGLADRLAGGGKLLGLLALELSHRLVTAFDDLGDRLLLLVAEAHNRVQTRNVPLGHGLRLQRDHRPARFRFDAGWGGIGSLVAGPEVRGSRQHDCGSQ